MSMTTPPPRPPRSTGSFTRLGSCLWDWQPWPSLELGERNLWLAFYTSPASKRLPPGLWHGGLGSMGEASKMGVRDVTDALEGLLAKHLVELDRRTWVLRLTELPDKGERPANGFVLKGWWTKFVTIPQCTVRDSHVAMIRWLSEPFSENHTSAWAETFGEIEIKHLGDRLVDRLVDRLPTNRASHHSPLQRDLFVSEDIRDRLVDRLVDGLADGLPDGLRDRQEREKEDLRSGSGSGIATRVPEAVKPTTGEISSMPHLRVVPAAPEDTTQKARETLATAPWTPTPRKL